MRILPILLLCIYLAACGQSSSSGGGQVRFAGPIQGTDLFRIESMRSITEQLLYDDEYVPGVLAIVENPDCWSDARLQPVLAADIYQYQTSLSGLKDLLASIIDDGEEVTASEVQTETMQTTQGGGVTADWIPESAGLIDDCQEYGLFVTNIEDLNSDLYDSSTALTGRVRENCTNGRDDDADGLIDGEDKVDCS